MNNLVIALFTLALLNVVYGGPVQQRSKREIYPEIEPEKVEDVQPQVCVVGDLVYGADESLPAEQPCLKCKCQPPGVHCEATRCQKKPGCRAIHKPNTCCPDYQCECEHEGKTYGNGERLEQQPGTECKVCYCRGGEVQCAEVSCYIRNDCEGRKVPGKCCPKYDHCPPKEPILDRTIYVDIVNASKEIENEINDTNKVTKIDQAVQTDDEPQKITIQEIIPSIKEIPITNSPKREINGAMQGQLLVEEEQTKLSTESNELLDVPDADSDSSEVAEIYQPPPVLRIGDKLLFLKKGELIPEKGASTPSTVITIIGAEGLQRGFEDSIENHDKIDKNNDPEDIQTVAESAHIFSLVQRPTEADDSTITTTLKATTEIEDNFFAANNSSIEIAVELPEYNPAEFDNITEAVTIAETTLPATNTHSVSPIPTKSTTEKEEVELNPEYPPIPDIMSPQNSDNSDHIEQETVKIEPKILSDVLEKRSNFSIPKNASNGAWLKQTVININATLPEDILTAKADSDDFIETTTESKIVSKFTEVTKFGVAIESTRYTQNHIKALAEDDEIETFALSTTSNPIEKSVESLEEGTTDESVTINASIEDMQGSTEMNMSDLVEMLPEANVSTNSNEDREIMTTIKNMAKDDVEMIDPKLLVSHVPSDEQEKNATHEEDAMHKVVLKRQNGEDDSIFEELDREIGLVSGEITSNKTKEEEDKEAETIFKELLEETQSNTTPKPIQLQPKDRESAVLQRVSDAIAKFQLRDTKQSLDSSILGILRDFFSSQYRSYNN